jgi:acetyltransferase-like isoleucine patch superfamily enzyme
MAPVFRAVYDLQVTVAFTFRWLYRVFYAGPLFRGRCDAVGTGFDLMKIPDAPGQTHLVLADDVTFQGHIGVGSGRVLDRPELLIGDRVTIGHDLVVTVNGQVRIDQAVRIGPHCRFMDTDSHPRDAISRAANNPPPADEIKPVRIGSNASIGRGSLILKGVSIGEGATVGVNSVVVAAIPAYSVVAGNPARILSRNAPPAQTDVPEQR